MKNPDSIKIQCQLLDLFLQLEEAKAYDAPWLEEAKKVYRDARGRFVSQEEELETGISEAIADVSQSSSRLWEGLNDVGKEAISRSLEGSREGIAMMLGWLPISQDESAQILKGSDRLHADGVDDLLRNMRLMDVREEPTLEEVGEEAAAFGTFSGLTTKILGVGAGVAGLSLAKGAKGTKAEIAKGVIGLAAGDLSAEGASYLLNETEGAKDMPAWQKQAIAGVAGVAGGLAAHKGLSKMGKVATKIPPQQNEAMGGRLNNVLKKAGIVGASGAAIKGVQDAIAQVQKQASDLLNIRKAQDDLGEAASKMVKTDGSTKVHTYVQTRTTSRDYHYRKYGSGDREMEGSEIDLIKALAQHIDLDDYSVILSKKGNKLLLTIGSQDTKYLDTGGRRIGINTTWVVENPSEKEYAQIKKLAAEATRNQAHFADKRFADEIGGGYNSKTGEYSGKIGNIEDDAVRYNSKGQRLGQEDTSIADWEVSDNALLDNKVGTPELKVKGKPKPKKGRVAKNSPDRREELAQENESADLSDDFTAVVTNIKGREGLKEKKVDRALSSIIDSENWSDL